MKKLFKSLLVTILLSTMLLSISYAKSLDSINTNQVPSSYDLRIEPLSQHRDTTMLDLDGSPLFGEDAWDVVHEEGCSCDLCNKYCGYASIAMINHFFTGNISQDRILYFANTSPDLMGPYLDHPEEDLHHIGLGTKEAATKTLSWSLSNATIYYFDGKPLLDSIKEWLYQNRPILTLVPGAPLHFIVTKGYDGSYLHIADPASGSEKKVLYDELDIIRVWVPINKFELLAPWIGLASLITVATVSFVYIKRRKKKQN